MLGMCQNGQETWPRFEGHGYAVASRGNGSGLNVQYLWMCVRVVVV